MPIVRPKPQQIHPYYLVTIDKIAMVSSRFWFEMARSWILFLRTILVRQNLDVSVVILQKVVEACAPYTVAGEPSDTADNGAMLAIISACCTSEYLTAVCRQWQSSFYDYRQTSSTAHSTGRVVQRQTLYWVWQFCSRFGRRQVQTHFPRKLHRIWRSDRLIKIVQFCSVNFCVVLCDVVSSWA